MKHIKVLLIQDVLSSYNSYVYELINKSVDLTVAYTTKTEIPTETASFKTLKLDSYKIGPFVIHKNINKLACYFNVIIFVPHLSFIKLLILPFIGCKCKLITWSIGVHASYKEPFNLEKKPSLKDQFFEYIQDNCDAAIFYMREPIEYWKKYKDISEEKYFVAHNTVKVAEYTNLPSYESRDSILFVGTLYKQKGIGELLEAYKKAYKLNKNLPKLVIVGKGPEKELIEQQINEFNLNEQIILPGAIYDEEKLKDYFLRSILCISPKQAGLSVQKSLGYGVPFVTRPDAITGGERLDVKDGINGIFYSTIDELADIIINTKLNPEYFRKLSNNAREYYLQNATPEIMAQGVLDAIRYVLNKKI